MNNTELKRNGEVLIPRVSIATGFFHRFMGLMGKKDLKKDEALCFPRCNSIHTFFMRFPIDVVFLDRNGVVLKVVSGLKPWRLLLPVLKAKHIIEMKPTLASELGIELGDKIECEGCQ